VRQVRRSGQRIFRLRVVVRPVVRMAPIVGAFGKQFDDQLAVDQRLAARPQHAQHFAPWHARRTACRPVDKHQVRQVVGQVQMRPRTLLRKDSFPQQPLLIGELAQVVDPIGSRQLNVDQQLVSVRQIVRPRLRPTTGQDDADAALDAGFPQCGEVL